MRHLPGSRKYPHFGAEPRRRALHDAGFDYAPSKDLGGRCKVQPDSPNAAWRHPAFRGYADYMRTDPFREGIARLKALPSKQHTAIMCS